jgi:hypothetical protein
MPAAHSLAPRLLQCHLTYVPTLFSSLRRIDPRQAPAAVILAYCTSALLMCIFLVIPHLSPQFLPAQLTPLSLTFPLQCFFPMTKSRRGLSRGHKVSYAAGVSKSIPLNKTSAQLKRKKDQFRDHIACMCYLSFFRLSPFNNFLCSSQLPTARQVIRLRCIQCSHARCANISLGGHQQR